MVKAWRRTVPLAVLAMACGGARADIAPAYRVQVLPSIQSGQALNDLGQVVGDGRLYTPGLGAVPIPAPAGPGLPWAINNRGTVAGESASGAYVYRADTGFQPIPTPPGSGGGFGAAYDINDRGVVVGAYGTAGNHAFVYTPGAGTIDLHGSRPGDSYAHAINEAGLIVGQRYEPGSGEPIAWYGTASTGMRDADASFGYGLLFNVNENGLAVGDFGASGIDHRSATFDTVSGGLHFLPFAPGWGDLTQTRGLNDAGQVTGAMRGPDGFYAAFLYDPGEDRVVELETLVDPTLRLTLVEAIDINNRGQILVNGWVGNGPLAAFVLTPVPEQGTLLLVALGAGALVVARRPHPGPDRAGSERALRG